MENKNIVEAEKHLNQGRDKYNAKDFDGAIEDYTQAISLNPKYSEAFTNRGIAKVELKNYEEAIKDIYSSY